MSDRRSRMHRTRTGKSLALTSRDIAIFRVLSEYRYLRSTYLHAFAGGASETRFKERLGDLYHEGYVDRPAKQWEFARARYQPAIHEIDERAKRVLLEATTEHEAPRTYLSSAAHRQFEHALLICECLASIELAVRACPNLRFIAWAEILARMPEETRMSPLPFRIPIRNGTVIPDGLFGLEYRASSTRSYRFFALEVDRGTMPISRADSSQTSYLAKLAGYHDIIDRRLHKQHWGISSLFVLTVTTSPERLARMLSGCAELSSSPLFLFKAPGPNALIVPRSGLLLEPWERADLPVLSISDSG
jgi:hypothetical protein